MSDHDYEIRESKLEDAFLMAHNMREVDVQEIWASHMIRPLEALVYCIRNSENSTTGLVDGEIACMFGIIRQNLLGSVGTIWLLGTDLLKMHGIRFLRENKKKIVEISEEFTIIENYCDARNRATLKWLDWLGFVIEEAKPYGIYNLPFHHFHKEVA